MLKRKQTSWDGLMRKKSTIYDPVRAKSKTEI